MTTAAFLPHLQETIMDELRTNEGVLFRDEVAKKLFIDTKEWVLSALTTAWNAFKDDLYPSVLARYAAWDEAAAAGIMEKAGEYPHAEARLLPSCVLYAKLLYGTYGGGGEPITIRKPSIDTLLRGMMTRLATQRLVMSGAFYEQDALRQDYCLRDIFRQALYDCIEIIETPQAQPQPTAIQRDDDDIYPDDSISYVMERRMANEERTKAKSVVSVPPSVLPFVAAKPASVVGAPVPVLTAPVPSVAPAPATAQHASLDRVESASRVTSASMASRATMRVPRDVKRVVISNEE